MTVSAIAPFLAPADEVQQTLAANPDFKGFLALALKSSGEALGDQDLSSICFRVADSRAGLRDDLGLDDMVVCWGQSVRIRDLIAGHGAIDRTQLVHSLWRLESFEEIKAWLKALRVVVRLARDLDGRLRGHILPAEAIIPMVETVERRDYVLPNGDMASDAITRNLGIRAKVFALDRQRRTPRQTASNSVMDRLSRTLSKADR